LSAEGRRTIGPRWLLVPLAGLALTLLSSAKGGETSATYSEIMGCEQSCPVAAAGWPFPYLVDYPGISVVGSADLSGALVGEDKFRLLPFVLTLAFWTAAAMAAALLRRRGAIAAGS
jgi:hypothetical protein